MVLGDLVLAAAGDRLLVLVVGGFIEGEVDAAVVGPVEFGGVAEGDVVAGGEDGVERVSGGLGKRCDKMIESEVVEQGSGAAVIGVFELEVQVSKEGVVCKCKGLSADIGDGVDELRSRTGWSVDEGAPEGGLGINVDLEVHVSGGAEGVFGVG
ncbi:hypothetical protein NDU88_006343 [Pleurodeles waltl]|uniref:Uncharacterized protein n=1 Tax=Pleurodeles waltl TaxID=8319 RepID=A0AAV7TDB1_PLEWA|nr:hypothetical protein NDU88_006343 [Pleurodeles waltl]